MAAAAESSSRSQPPSRNCALGAHHQGLSTCLVKDRKVARVCRYFQRGFCFPADGCSYQRLMPSAFWAWGHRHSEPCVTLPVPPLGLTRWSSEPECLPSVAAGWGAEPGVEGLASRADGGSWKSLPPPSADRDPSPSLEPQPRAESDVVPQLAAALQSLDLEAQQGTQDSQDVVCGICMDRVWAKPEAERVFGILPNCGHAHCLGCLRTWRRTQHGLPLDIIKACPQCRVYSSYIIPHKFWVSGGVEKEELIRTFKARTSQIQCRFFIRRNGHCPFKSDCIYLHQFPVETLASSPSWPEGVQLASGSEVLGPVSFLQATKPEEADALALAFWSSELLPDLSSPYHGLLLV